MPSSPSPFFFQFWEKLPKLTSQEKFVRLENVVFSYKIVFLSQQNEIRAHRHVRTFDEAHFVRTIDTLEKGKKKKNIYSIIPSIGVHTDTVIPKNIKYQDEDEVESGIIYDRF